jgi:hypothetical protein
MSNTRIIRPSRLRILTKYFSPVPHQLIRDGHLARLQPSAVSLYLFLICVGDKNGVSYYSDVAISRKINLKDISQSREELIRADLVGYDKPLYQVLSLPVNSAAINTPQSAAMDSAQTVQLKNDFNDHLKQYLKSIDGDC